MAHEFLALLGLGITGYLSWTELTGGSPSCVIGGGCATVQNSEYAEIAIEIHGPWRGGWLTARRLSRCRPFGPSGFDPVPSRDDDVTGS